MKFYISGDAHNGENLIRKLSALSEVVDPAEQAALIILGDAGLNFWLNNKEKRQKEEIAASGIRLYLVRGNHEQDPSDLGYDTIYDEDVRGEVFVDSIANNIRYLKDGGEYVLGEHSALVLGGAYSVDKFHRLARARETGNSFSGWFEHEQLSPEAMVAITEQTHGKHYDVILSHTCPKDFQPTDAFLGFIDQTLVDDTMEVWMDKLKDTMFWGLWLLGHYHLDRVELPHVEIFYNEIEQLGEIIDRWKIYDRTGKLPWYIPVSPRMERLMDELPQ